MSDRPVLQSVSTSQIFQESAQLLEQRLSDALLESAHATRIVVASNSHGLMATIQVSDVNHVESLEAVVASSLTVIAQRWASDARGQLPQRRLECIIPPDVKSASWNSIQDTPRTFLLKIEATLTPGQDVAPRILPYESSDHPRALVMKGGGIKGLAYVGALEILSESYSFDHFVGTSAGAISALLLAAGYTPAELKEILQTKNFRDFFDAPWYITPFNLVFYRGLYRAQTFTDWIDDLLAKKLNSPTRVRMSELPNRATVFASRRNKSALRFDSKSDDADAGHAARCSMSIPLIFVPQSDQGFRTYDGGMQHNYPVDELCRENPGNAFVSLYLGSETYKPTRNRFEFWEWVSIWTEGGDADLLKRYRDRTVMIDPDPIGTLDFDLCQEEKDLLLQCGRVGALAHLEPGSERHNAATQLRDDLRGKVVAIRAARRRLWRKKQCFLFLGIGSAIVGCVVGNRWLW
jgi:predicted acylesterase/phospholipase RssA